MDDHIHHTNCLASWVRAFLRSLGPACWPASWILVNIQGALTWKNRLGSRTKVPISPKKLEVVIFQEQLANLPRPCKCNKCSRLPPPRLPLRWPWRPNLRASDCSEVTNDGRGWEKVTFKHSTGQWGGCRTAKSLSGKVMIQYYQTTGRGRRWSAGCRAFSMINRCRFQPHIYLDSAYIQELNGHAREPQSLFFKNAFMKLLEWQKNASCCIFSHLDQHRTSVTPITPF